MTFDSSTILHSLSVILFVIGLLGIVLRKNTIVILMCIELMLNAVNLSFVTFSKDSNNLSPQMMVFFIISIAAAESAVGLSIIVNLYRNFGSIHTDKSTELKG
jgi:NADH-quinone oxidoreductase subunit K